MNNRYLFKVVDLALFQGLSKNGSQGTALNGGYVIGITVGPNIVHEGLADLIGA